MYPEDRVLVAFVPQPSDFELARSQNWYRVPQRHAPKGIHSEYFAFYFGRRFEEKKWAIHYYARNLGHELLTRRDLLPDESSHPRADNLYYKVQLGPLLQREHPILSLRWRRVTFIHTTWDRFVDAREINDLFVEGEPYVDRLYATLKEYGVQAERNYRVSDSHTEYEVPIMIPCRHGRIEIDQGSLPKNPADVAVMVQQIIDEVESKGGITFQQFT
ncbi:MAG: hypothetical protein R3293_08320 [Candidatus Promineifilaceae bacterium]|nr:hypothetical protein [Candidatus Promineifilaceae bacterium]